MALHGNRLLPFSLVLISKKSKLYEVFKLIASVASISKIESRYILFDGLLILHVMRSCVLITGISISDKVPFEIVLTYLLKHSIELISICFEVDHLADISCSYHFVCFFCVFTFFLASRIVFNPFTIVRKLSLYHLTTGFLRKVL